MAEMRLVNSFRSINPSSDSSHLDRRKTLLKSDDQQIQTDQKQIPIDVPNFPFAFELPVKQEVH